MYHPDMSKIGHEPVAVRAYYLLQKGCDLLLDADQRKAQLDAWRTVLIGLGFRVLDADRRHIAEADSAEYRTHESADRVTTADGCDVGSDL